MRIELTIRTDYLPGWRAWEGIRELIQNAKDAEREFDAPMTVTHRKDSNTLVIENVGTTLPHEALLLGYTSKSNRSDMIGKFGEGLKLGILALVREGAEIKIRSGSEVWVPRIVLSEKFDAKVLAFDILKNREEKNRVQIEIKGINLESWEDIRERFLFLTEHNVLDRIDTSHGSLLLGPGFVGKIYVRGIFIMNSPLQYGYDLTDVDVDRDRKMVDQASLRWRLSSVWKEVLNSRPDLAGEFFKMLENQAQDLDGMDSWTAKNLGESVLGSVTKRFHERYGDNALPVTNIAQSAEIEHLGMSGIVVPSAMRAVLEAKLGTVEENKSKLSNMPKRMYSWNELTTDEQSNLIHSLKLVAKQDPVDLSDVDIVDFRVDTFEGMFRDGRVLVAKRMLSDFDKTLAVVVHEVAHRAGGDGEQAHVAQIERLWGGIVKSLRGAS